MVQDSDSTLHLPHSSYCGFVSYLVSSNDRQSERKNPSSEHCVLNVRLYDECSLYCSEDGFKKNTFDSSLPPLWIACVEMILLTMEH